jgi:putative ABC transport system permease protein
MSESAGGLHVRTAPVRSNEALVPDVRIFAATEDLVTAVGADLVAGRYFDHGHSSRGDAVALVGAAAASRLGLREGASASAEAIFVDDIPLVVIGVFENSEAAPELLTGVVVPWGFADKHLDVGGPTRFHVSTEVGATEVVAQQIGLALFPRDPLAISVAHGPQPTRLASQVTADVDFMFLLTGALVLLVASFGIANTSLVTVMERIPEIGLRRALGIAPRDIGATFLLESSILGGVGGVSGASAWVVITVVVSAVRDWTPVLDY